MLTFPRTPPERLVFKPNNNLHRLLVGTGLWIFFGVLEAYLYWASYITTDVMLKGNTFQFWILTLFLLVFLYYTLLQFRPKEGWLTLDSKGFQLNSYAKAFNHDYAWEEVQEFFITRSVTTRGTSEVISFRLHKSSSYSSKNLAPYRYSVSTRELAQILSDWKKQYTLSQTNPASFEGSDTARQSSGESTASQITLPRVEEIRILCIDPKIEKISFRWYIALLISGIAFFGFMLSLAGKPNTTYKFYNFQPKQPAVLTLTVKQEEPDKFVSYHLPPIPYMHRLELRVPRPLFFPIRVQYFWSQKAQCYDLEKQYGIWSQMDAIWVNPNGGMAAYATPYCKGSGRSCVHMPDQAFITKCSGQVHPLSEAEQNGKLPKNAHVDIQPMSASDFTRLEEKTNFDRRRYRVR